MIAACVPALHPVYDKFINKMAGHKSIDCASPTQPEPGAHAHPGRRHGFWTVVMKGISQISGTTLNTATENSRSVKSAAAPTGQIHWSPDRGDEKQASAAVVSSVPMRSLEDAADIQHPPDAIWIQRVNGAHGVRRPGHG